MPTIVKREGTGAVQVQSERLLADLRLRLVSEDGETVPVRLVTSDAEMELDLPGRDVLSSCGPERLELRMPLDPQAAQRLMDVLWRCGVRPTLD